MLLAISKYKGSEILPEFESLDLPHTLSFAILYRMRINSYGELPDDKQPPRNLWDKPWRLSEYMKDIWTTDSKPESKGKEYIEFNPDEIE